MGLDQGANRGGARSGWAWESTVSQKPEGEFSDRMGLEELLKRRQLDPIPRDSSSVGLGSREFAVVTSYHVLLLLLPQRSHFENH